MLFIILTIAFLSCHIRSAYSIKLFGNQDDLENQLKWFNFSVYNSYLLTLDSMESSKVYKTGKHGLPRDFKRGQFSPDIYLDGLHVSLEYILSVKPRTIESSLLRRILDMQKIRYGGKIEFKLSSDFHNRIWILDSHTDPVFDAELDKTDDLYDFWGRWRWYIYFFYSHVVHTESFVNRPFLQENNLEALSLAFIFQVCKALRRKNVTDQRCPNPCAARPCKIGRFLVNENCQLNELGLFEDDYQCNCLFSYKWSSYTRSCVRDDLCIRNQYCYQWGTEQCIYLNAEDVYPTCYCSEAHMGRRCDEIRNPCIERYDSSKMAGNIACNIGNNSNRCVSLMASDHFKCECGKQWSRSSEISEPNCLQRRSFCDSEICVHGQCHSSRDGRIGACSCFGVYLGRHCEEKIPEWAKWTVWSQCIPLCGNTRRKYRMRQCNGKNCSGLSQESEFCSSLNCNILNKTYEGFSLSQWKLSYQFYLLGVILQTTICSSFIVASIITIFKL